MEISRINFKYYNKTCVRHVDKETCNDFILTCLNDFKDNNREMFII